MRFFPAFLCFSVLFSVAAVAAPPTPAVQPSPTDTYITARDRYLAEFKAHPTQGDADKREVRALADLERLIKLAVPAWTAPGFPATGKINLSALDDNEMGLSVLNGLVYSAGGTAVIVTNRALLMRWLADRHKTANGGAKVPVSIPAAFRTEDFWTFASFDDAAAQLYGLVLVKALSGADMATVELAVFAQDLAMDAGPDTLLVAVVRGDRVFIAKQKLTLALAKPPVCKKALDQTLTKSAAALKAYQDSLKGTPAGKVKDATRFDDHIALEDKADWEYRACFAQHLMEQPNYTAVQRQAQALVDLLH
jgi:hypothetical protein